MPTNPYRNLPAVSQVLAHPTLMDTLATHPTPLVTEAVRAEVAQLRAAIETQTVTGVDLELGNIAVKVMHRVNALAAYKLRTTINATGIVIHTNLGRSPMAEVAAQAAYRAAKGYLNLEMDLTSGARSSRQDPVREGIRRITGAEAGTVVNNCAAATVIVLRALAAGREVIVSRGQLIEIGGSFRIPDIMTVSGATLREVGTTNITRASDYGAAIGPNTAMLMRIHTSNFRVRGFTKAVELEELVALGKKYNLLVVDDVGSGAVMDFAAYGLPGEPVVSESILTGADLILFSGDKLLGGPQAGIIAGRASLIKMIEKDPMMRAFRCDKMTLAALEATLNLYRDPQQAKELIPTLRMLSVKGEVLRKRTELFAARLKEIAAYAECEVSDAEAFVGGGSLPDVSLPTTIIAIHAKHFSEEEIASRLRAGSPAVVARVKDGRVLLDLRTVLDGQEDELLAAITAAVLPNGSLSQGKSGI